MTISKAELKRRAILKEQKALQTDDSSAFRQTEHFWKSRLSEPDVSAAFSSADDVTWLDEECGTWTGRDKEYSVRRVAVWLDVEAARCTGRQEAMAYTFDDLPGLIYLPSLLSPSAQRELAECCLLEGPKEPNMTSLDPHYDLPLTQGLWQAASLDPNKPIAKTDNTIGQDSLVRTKIDLKPITKDNFASERAEERAKDVQVKKIKNDTVPLSEVWDKLRWASVGLKYHWGTKSYELDSPAPAIPRTIADLSTSIIRSIPWTKLTPSSGEWKDYKAEGGIINFYRPRDQLCAHIDHSEASLRPLVSLSLGRSAVFLIGGTSREITPLSMLLKSGDVVIMSGESRRAFHGVPRVLDDGQVEGLEGKMADWLKDRRINVNVRQVWPGEED